MISQIIMGLRYCINSLWNPIESHRTLRAYSIAGRSRNVGLFLIVYGIIASVLEGFGSLYGRVMIQQDVGSSTHASSC